MNVELNSTSHAKGLNLHHFEWCTKYRYSMLRQDKYKKLCEECVRAAAQRHGMEIREIGIVDNHVHVHANLPMTMSPVKAEQLLKGYSAYLLFRAEPKFRLRYPKGHFWSPGKFSVSVGYATVDTVDSYVRNQEEHHALLAGNSAL